MKKAILLFNVIIIISMEIYGQVYKYETYDLGLVSNTSIGIEVKRVHKQDGIIYRHVTFKTYIANSLTDVTITENYIDFDEIDSLHAVLTDFGFGMNAGLGEYIILEFESNDDLVWLLHGNDKPKNSKSLELVNRQGIEVLRDNFNNNQLQEILRLLAVAKTKLNEYE